MARRHIDEFEIGDVLGVGTVGTIYRCTDKRSGQAVALKRLLPMVASNALIVRRFEREMLILEKLSHPNIVQYYGGGKDGDHLFYAMEVVSGGTMKQLLSCYGSLTWQEAVACGTQLCSALQHAHNHGILHRDLKPANLYISEAGELKLGDFGVARDLGEADITASGLTVGSHAYMSPEQITGKRDISGKTDLYALGCLLFEMVTGRTPFLGDNFAQLFEQHLRKEPPNIRDFVPNAPPELEHLITSLLAKDPEQRPFNARNVQATLLKICEQYEIDDSDADVERADARDSVTIRKAQHRLVTRIEQLDHQTPFDVSWKAVATLFVVIVGIIVACWQLGS